MKKITTLLVAIFAVCFTANAQFEYGLKAGLSFNTNGELKHALSEAKQIIDTKGSAKTGFNVGLYGKINLGPVYVRPELIYTKTTSEYTIAKLKKDFSTSRIDMPVLLGFSVIGPLDIIVGPAFQYTLDNDFDGFKYDDIKNDVTVGLNIGLAANFGRLGVDARYERGFSKNEVSFIDKNITNTANYKLDSRPEQFIISLSYKLN